MSSSTAASLLASLNVTNAIDTHLHPWRLTNLPPVIEGAKMVRPDLAQDYSPARVVRAAKESGFSGVIFVHARDPNEDAEGEAQFFVEGAREHPEVLGCVVGIDLLDSKGTEAFLNRQRGNKVVRGCRMIRPENSGVGILSDERTKVTAKALGERGLRLDLLLRSSNPGQLAEGVALVQWLAENSETVVIGDHLLKPTGVATATPSDEWKSALKALARCPNFYLKISGLPGEVPPGTSHEIFHPFYDAAFEALGADRLLFGSDHPVSYGFSEAVVAVAEWLKEKKLTTAGIPQKIFSENAKRAYGL